MINIPKAAIQDDSDEPATPEVGDTVELKNVTVVIKSVSNDGYEADVKSVNGEDCESCEDMPDDEGAELMKKAAKEDADAGMD